MPEIVIIAALAERNRVIGKDQHLPWRIPEDLKRFKRLTTGHALVMGRRTFESLVQDFGGPLPDRRNIVITSRGPIAGFEQVETVSGIDAALAATQGEAVVWIGGGAGIYRQFIDRADRLELTLVEGNYEGDTFFPPYEHLVDNVYRLEAEEPHDGFRFVTYRRIQGAPAHE